jgi:hypothetical protein
LLKFAYPFRDRTYAEGVEAFSPASNPPGKKENSLLLAFVFFVSFVVEKILSLMTGFKA